MDALLAEAEHLWKDSEFAAAIANYDRALEMVCTSPLACGECLRVVHPSGARGVVPLVQARTEGLVAREDEILIGKAFALLNLPSDFEGKVTRGNEGMEILRQVHRMALAADERWLRAHSTSKCCDALRCGLSGIHATCCNPSRAEQGKASFVKVLMDRHGQLSIGGECKSVLLQTSPVPLSCNRFSGQNVNAARHTHGGLGARRSSRVKSDSRAICSLSAFFLSASSFASGFPRCVRSAVSTDPLALERKPSPPVNMLRPTWPRRSQSPSERS